MKGWMEKKKKKKKWRIVSSRIEDMMIYITCCTGYQLHKTDSYKHQYIADTVIHNAHICQTHNYNQHKTRQDTS